MPGNPRQIVVDAKGRVPVRGRVAILALVLCLALRIGAGPYANPDSEIRKRGENVTALSVLRPLAEEGDSFAQLALGVMYFNGWNTPRDYVQARKWFNLASSRSPPGADHDAALAGCNLVGAKMTPSQIDEAQTLTQEWFFDLIRRHSVRP
jgi:TPR repeat protein